MTFAANVTGEKSIATTAENCTENPVNDMQYLARVLFWELTPLLLTSVVGVRSMIMRPLLDRLLLAAT